MPDSPAATAMSLFASALAEQHEKNAAALAAIHNRRADIEELERFTRALGTRGLRVLPRVAAFSIGASVSLRLQICVTATMAELGQVLEWLTAADIAPARRDDRDVGSIRAYSLKLRALDIDMSVRITTTPASAALTAARSA